MVGGGQCCKVFVFRGDGNWHVGIYASPDNWRTCVKFCLNDFVVICMHMTRCKDCSFVTV